MTAQGIVWWRRLHVRLMLVVLTMTLLLGGALLAVARHYAAASALEATQRLHLNLARYIAEHQPRPLIGADGQPDRELLATVAMQVMAINPAVEVYLLDPEGRVIGHALDGAGTLAPQVDMASVRPLAQRTAAMPRLPLLGDDPRRPGQRNVVSVEGLAADGRMTGYLYVVLLGQTQQAVASSLAQSDAWRVAAALGLLALAAAAAVLALSVRRLTRPLRQLTRELHGFRADHGGVASGAAATPAADEVDALRQATHAMRRRIDEQLTRLQDNDRLRRELIGNISHDLHTPLAGIQGYVETLLLRGERLDAGEREQHLRTVLRHTSRLHRRIADLFELAKLDAGQREPQLEAFCLAELLQDVVQGYQLAAHERGVQLVLAAGSHGQARVQADIALIERVLQNLIDNALRHTGRGGSITLALAVPAGTPGRELQVSVLDTGTGIAREHLPHIFERYWRAADGAPVEGGRTSAGLGLAIVKRILDLHGATVQVRSEPARGTCFEFALAQAA